MSIDQIYAKIQSLFRRISFLSNKIKDAELPVQTGNAGKALVTNGTTIMWATPTAAGTTRDPYPMDGSTNSVESNGVFDALSTKVDVVAGKQLSTEDYTTPEKTKLGAISGTNTGDETLSSIKSKLGITTLSGSNTGDQDLSSYVTLAGAQTLTNKTIDASQLSGSIADIRLSSNISLLNGAQTFSASKAFSTTGDLSLYNTSDQVTNYERVRQYWSGNVFNIAAQNGGTGTARNVSINGSNFQADGSIINPLLITTPTLRSSGSNSLLQLQYGTVYNGTANTTGLITGGLNNTKTAGQFVALSIAQTYNQTSSTSSNTDLLISRTETSLGSGAQKFIDAQVGGTSKFSVSNTGKISISTSAISGDVFSLTAGLYGREALSITEAGIVKTVWGLDVGNATISQNGSTGANWTPGIININGSGSIGTLNGSSASGGSLTLNSTSNAVKGKIFFGANSAYDGANERLGIGTSSPTAPVEIQSDLTAAKGLIVKRNAGQYININQGDGSRQLVQFMGDKPASFTNESSGQAIGFEFNTQSTSGGAGQAMTIMTNRSIGIGTTAPASTAILDIGSTTRGVLFPRMTTTQRTAITLDSTNDGLMVYDITLHKLFLNENGTWAQK